MAAPFRTEITADPTQYNATMEAAANKAMTTGQAIASSMRESSAQMAAGMAQANASMNKSFDSVAAAMGKVRGMMAGIAAVMGGGAVFGKFVSETAQITGETVKLSKMLGVTTQEATALRIALGDIGVETESYTGMVGKMTMKLRDNEERFNELGVKTRGANGELLNTGAVMTNALGALQQFKAGTDRNLASTELFGRGWEEVMKLMRLTPALMNEAKIKADELQLTIGPDGAERSKQYKLAMNDVKDVMEAMANRVGQAVLPVLTDLGQWFASIGPVAVQVMRGAIGGLMTAFYGLRTGVVIVFEVIRASIFMAIEPLAALLEAAFDAMHGRFAEAGARLREIPKQWSASWAEAFRAIGDSARTSHDRIAAMFDFGTEQGGVAKTGGGGKAYTPKIAAPAGAAESRMAKFEEELAALRDAREKEAAIEGSFREFTKAEESAFWQAKLSLSDLSSKELIAVSRKYYAAEHDVRKAAFEAEQEDYKLRIDAARKGSNERVTLAIDAALKVRAAYGEESKEFKKSWEEVLKLEHERNDQITRLNELKLEGERAYQISRLELERQSLENLEALGQITARQKLERLRVIKEEEFQIELKAAQDKAALMQGDLVQYQEQLNRIEQIKQKHQIDLSKIDGQIQVEMVRPWKTVTDAITGSFSTAVKGVIQGTQTLGQAMRNMTQTVFLALIDLGAKTLAQMALNAVIGKTIDKVSALGKIADNAAVAASAAFAATAGIPMIGPALAPEAAAAAFAGAMSWGASLSAARGFDVPAGVNPMTQLHQKEMVLPAHLAEPIRDGIARGRGMGGGDTVVIQAMDSQSFQQFSMRDPEALRGAVSRLARNGGNYRRW